jgi:hypothetical protein
VENEDGIVCLVMQKNGRLDISQPIIIPEVDGDDESVSCSPRWWMMLQSMVILHGQQIRLLVYLWRRVKGMAIDY